MREILYRGKMKGAGVWVYGAYCGVNCETPFSPSIKQANIIMYDEPYDGYWVEVYPETVGQYTGLTDKNGKKIFEGDLFRMEDDIIAVVTFKDGCFRLELHGLCGTFTESGFDECGGGYGVIECDPIDWYYIRDMEVIGNIHDKPELIGGTEDGEKAD